jgi:hypothetical protein
MVKINTFLLSGGRGRPVPTSRGRTLEKEIQVALALRGTFANKRMSDLMLKGGSADLMNYA